MNLQIVCSSASTTRVRHIKHLSSKLLDISIASNLVSLRDVYLQQLSTSGRGPTLFDRWTFRKLWLLISEIKWYISKYSETVKMLDGISAVYEPSLLDIEK